MFKEKLKQLRKINNYTQTQVAKMLNMSKTGYASWEQGLSEPSIEDIKKLSVIYNITTDELLEFETKEQRKAIHINNSFNNTTNNGNINF